MVTLGSPPGSKSQPWSVATRISFQPASSSIRSRSTKLRTSSAMLRASLTPSLCRVLSMMPHSVHARPAGSPAKGCNRGDGRLGLGRRRHRGDANSRRHQQASHGPRFRPTAAARHQAEGRRRTAGNNPREWYRQECPSYVFLRLGLHAWGCVRDCSMLAFNLTRSERL